MDVRDGYKQTEVGEIPEDWQVHPLGALTDRRRPIAYGIVQTGPRVLDGVKCLRVLDVGDGRINKADLITTSKAISERYERTVLKSGDLVMPLRGKVGDVALVGDDLSGCNLTRGLSLIAIMSDWSGSFCRQSLTSSATRNRLVQSMNGSALQEIPIATLRTFKIALPPSRAEQEAIAGALSDTDALLESLEHLLAKKRQVKQGAMQDLLTGKKRLPGFSGEWEVKRLGELAQLLNRPVYPGLRPKDLFTHFSLPAFDAGASPIVEEGAQIRSHKFSVPRSAVLVSKLNPRIPRIWAPTRIPTNAISSTEFLVLLPNDRNDRNFLAFLCASPTICGQMILHAIGTTGSHQRIRPMQAMEIKVLTPCEEAEQTAIAAVLSDMDAEIVALEAKLSKARLIKQGMMQELLTGRIRLV